MYEFNPSLTPVGFGVLGQPRAQIVSYGLFHTRVDIHFHMKWVSTGTSYVWVKPFSYLEPSQGSRHQLGAISYLVWYTLSYKIGFDRYLECMSSTLLWPLSGLGWQSGSTQGSNRQLWVISYSGGYTLPYEMGFNWYLQCMSKTIFIPSGAHIWGDSLSHPRGPVVS